MPRKIREQSPEAVRLLQKCYDDLTIEDCVTLMNIRCDYVRSQHPLSLQLEGRRSQTITLVQELALKASNSLKP